MALRYMIDSRIDPHTGWHVFTVWRVASDGGEPDQLGEYDSAQSAQRSLSVDWRPPDAGSPDGWLFLADEDAGETDEELYSAPSR
jgi:hypothetical protein